MIKQRNLPEICFDTNVVLDLIKYEDNQKVEKLKRKSKYFAGLYNLRELLESEALIPVISPTVETELYSMQFKDGLMIDSFPFMREKGFEHIVMNAQDSFQFFEDTRNLAFQYPINFNCQRLKYGEKYSEDPIDKKKNLFGYFSKRSHYYNLAFDAYIMAECSLLNCPLITNNLNDFIYYGKDESIQSTNHFMKHHIDRLILNNKKNHREFDEESLRRISSSLERNVKPYSVFDYTSCSHLPYGKISKNYRDDVRYY